MKTVSAAPDIKTYIQELEEKGFVKIPQVYSREETQNALDLLKTWFEKTRGEQSANVPKLNQKHPMVYNLQSKEPYFLNMITGKENIMAILKHFLNDPWYRSIPKEDPNFILRSFLGRSSTDVLPLHIDSYVPYQGNHVYSLQMAIILEDQNAENGCTVFVPGSHKSGEFCSQEAMKDAVPVSSEVGDAVIFDSRTWHGTTENRSGGTRWSAIATFTRWWLKQAFDIPRNVPQEVYEQMTESQKAILGFCSIPYNNETEGIDMKRGYDSLLSNVADYK